MYKMLDEAYHDGARYICLTPHFHPGYYGNNQEKSLLSFERLCCYAQKNHPSLKLALGNELHYERGCVSWLEDEKCRTLNKTKFVLIDFRSDEIKHNISDGLDSLLRAGYIPILAHAERYNAICRDHNFLSKYKRSGMLIQVNAGSLFGAFGLRARHAAKKLIKSKLADFISSDAHNLDTRAPGIKKAYQYAEIKCGKDYADAICFSNAYHLIFSEHKN